MEEHMKGAKNMTYDKPTMCCIVFDEQDIVTASQLTNGGIGEDEELRIEDLQ